MTHPPSASFSDLVSVSYLQSMWRGLSNRFFESKLPAITIEWSTRLTASSGLFSSHIGPRSLQMVHPSRYREARVIRLSAPLLRGQPEAEVRRTLAHEMIHQWEFDIRKRWPSHGALFRQKMDRMNEEGLDVAIRHQLHEQVEACNRYVWRCVRCGLAYQRQRRTIVPSRHVCSRCRGVLVEGTLAKPDTTIRKKSLGNESFQVSLQPEQMCFKF